MKNAAVRIDLRLCAAQPAERHHGCRFTRLTSDLTVGSGVAVRAGASVVAVAVVAGAAVLARLGVALVDVVLAVAACESRRAQTRESVDAVHAGATVEAGAAGTLLVEIFFFFKRKNGRID